MSTEYERMPNLPCTVLTLTPVCYCLHLISARLVVDGDGVFERLKCGADGRRVRNARPLSFWFTQPRHSALTLISCRKEVQHFISSRKTRTFHGKDSTKKSSNLLHHLVAPQDGPHYSLIGSETIGLYSLRRCISVSHRGLCCAGDTTCTVRTPPVRPIRHTCVILSLHSGSHKSSGCDDGDRAGQKATIDAVQHETCRGKSIMESNLCEAVPFTRSRPEAIAPQPTSSKRLADSDDDGISELEAVSDGKYSSTRGPLVSCCTGTTSSCLSVNQLIETSSSITPHAPRKLESCDLCA